MNEWEKGEREADEDIKAGRVKESMRELITDLKKDEEIEAERLLKAVEK